jgi:pimeloyl-ACP methyl ester carboxylesterase
VVSRTPIAACLIGAILVVGACSSSAHHAAAPTTEPSTTVPATTTTTTPPTVTASANSSAFYTPPTPLPPGPPGTIIRAEVVTGVAGVPAGATVFRALYKSETIYGDPIAVSGYFVVPPGSPPAGGWNILTWAHGTTGVTTSCFPSRFDLTGSKPYLLPDLGAFLAAHFVVAATDYEGLTGFEPYLLGASEGRGVLDAARAARNLPGVPTSNRVGIYGHSQGGHAALFAGELASTYAPDLHVVGVAAAAPATNLTTIMKLAPTETSAGVLSFQIEAGWSWVQAYHDLPAADLFTARGIAAAPGLLAGCLRDTEKAIVAQQLTGAELFDANLASDPVVVSHTQANDPGRVKTAVPILVVQGTADTTVPPVLTDAYVQKMACPIGDTIDYEKFPHITHGTIPYAGAEAVLAFLQAPPGTSTCGQPGDSHTQS